MILITCTAQQTYKAHCIAKRDCLTVGMFAAAWSHQLQQHLKCNATAWRYWFSQTASSHEWYRTPLRNYFYSTFSSRRFQRPMGELAWEGVAHNFAGASPGSPIGQTIYLPQGVLHPLPTLCWIQCRVGLGCLPVKGYPSECYECM